MLVSLQQFKDDFRMLDEACRQWYAFIQEDDSRANGQGFAEFYNELCQQKYHEYLQNPDDFYAFKPTFPVFLALDKPQAETLAEVLANALCGHNEPQTEAVLSDLSERLDDILENEERMGMTL